MTKSSKKTAPKFIQNPDIIGSQIDDEMVMMDVEKGAYFGLDAVASFIWQTLEKPHSTQDIVDKILKDFEVSQKQCEEDIAPFIKHLSKANLVIKATD